MEKNVYSSLNVRNSSLFEVFVQGREKVLVVIKHVW